MNLQKQPLIKMGVVTFSAFNFQFTCGQKNFCMLVCIHQIEAIRIALHFHKGICICSWLRFEVRIKLHINVLAPGKTGNIQLNSLH